MGVKLLCRDEVWWKFRLYSVKMIVEHRIQIFRKMFFGTLFQVCSFLKYHVLSSPIVVAYWRRVRGALQYSLVTGSIPCSGPTRPFIYSGSANWHSGMIETLTCILCTLMQGNIAQWLDMYLHVKR